MSSLFWEVPQTSFPCVWRGYLPFMGMSGAAGYLSSLLANSEQPFMGMEDGPLVH